MIEVPSSVDRIVVVGDFELFTPADLFLHWVTADLVTQWWPAEATIDPRVEGRFEFRWPEFGWTLSGQYTSFVVGEHLGFTWSWSHDPVQASPTQVDVYFQPVDDGCRMSIFHGPFSGEDAKERAGVLEGWLHFGMLLEGLRREPGS